MSTHSLTVVKDGPHTLVSMYKQCDGSPEGYGYDLAKFLAKVRITNGVVTDDREKLGSTANTPLCLAAQIVAKFKEGAGEVYLQPPWEEGEDMYVSYAYLISCHEDDLHVRVLERTFDEAEDRRVMFEGNVKDFKAFCQKHYRREAARWRRLQKKHAAAEA